METICSLRLNWLVRPLILAAVAAALAVCLSRAPGTVAALADAGRPVGDKAIPPAACQDHPAPSPDALRSGDSTCGGIDLRHSKLSVSVVSRSGSFKSQLPEGLRYLGVRRPISPPTSFQILFCTWQA